MRLVLKRGHQTPPLSLAEVEQQLWGWEVPQTMWACAKARGMPRDEFVPSYHQFVVSHYRRVNRRGEPLLGTIERAKYYGWYWLRDQTEYPSVNRLRTDPGWRMPASRPGPAKTWAGKCSPTPQ